MRASLQAIETAGREATAELRWLLGILRRPDDEPALAPVPGLARVGVLVEQMRAAGLPTELRIEGKPSAPRELRAGGSDWSGGCVTRPPAET